MRFGVIVVLLVFSVTLGCMGGESPEALQAKSELAQIDGQIAALQAKISAIPALEYSDNVNSDLDLQINFMGIFAILVPNEKQNPFFVKEYMAFMDAFKSRDYFSIEDYPSDDPIKMILSTSLDMTKIIDDDLEELNKLADNYDSAVDLAKAGIQEIPGLTVEKTSDTEKYFQEHAKKKAQYEALAASIPSETSDGFRAKVVELKNANGIFKDTLYKLKDSESLMIFITTPEMKKFSPDAYTISEKIENCFSPDRDVEFCESADIWEMLINPFYKTLKDDFKKLKE